MNKQNGLIGQTRTWLTPLVVVLAVVPLIVLVHGYDNTMSEYTWFGNAKKDYDLYLYYKALLLKTCGAIASVIVIGAYFRSKPTFLYEKKNYTMFIALFVYTILTVISSVFSAHAWSATFGGTTRFEGCYVILSYVVFFYMAFGYARSLELIHYLLDALLIGATVLSFIGVIESIGIDVYNWDWLVSLLFFLEPDGGSLAANDTVMVTGTLENANYVGSYVALVLPYCIYTFISRDKLWRRILSGVLIDLLGIFLVGSESEAGLVAVLAGIIVTLFFVFPDLNRISKIIISSIGVSLVIILTFVLLLGDFGKNFFVRQKKYPINNIETDFCSAVITFSDGKRLRVTLDEKKCLEEGWGKNTKTSELISVIDEDSKESFDLNVDEDNKYILDEEGYPRLSFYQGWINVPKEKSITGENTTLDILFINDGYFTYRFSTYLGANMCYLYDVALSRVLLKNVDRIGFDGMYDFASGRGYIWACTIPLLKDYIFLGAGQDNYIYVFPNDDYIGKKLSGFDGMYLSKPHNMYLGIWVQQGLIALIAFLFIYVLFMVRVIRLCYGRYRIKSTRVFSAKGVAITTAVATTGYMVAGLANDSNVGVTPIYWVMLGVGYAAEAICRKKDETSDDATKELPDVSEINSDEDDVLVEDATFEEL